MVAGIINKSIKLTLFSLVCLLPFVSSFAVGGLRMTSASFPKGQKPASKRPYTMPRLYVYDHCPYCVRARMILGLKKVRHELVFLANDEIDIPTSLIGKKAVPILELGEPGSKNHEVLPESMDIVRRVDNDCVTFGGDGPILQEGEREDIEAWVQRSSVLMRRLMRPRHVKAPLPEFQFQASRDAFITNHPLPEPSSYEENLGETSYLKGELEKKLVELPEMMFSETCVSEGGPSYMDISFWSRMRSITIIKDLDIPPKLLAYLKHYSKECDIPLYTKMAM